MDYLKVITEKDYTKVRQIFESKKPTFYISQHDSINQYKVKEHDVFDPAIRKKKKIVRDTGAKKAGGGPATRTEYIDVARIGMSFQELIVTRRVGFMLSDPVRIDVTYDQETDIEKNLIKLIERIQNDNKMDFKNKEIARRMMSELECAEIWYFVENKEPNFFKRLFGVKSKFTIKMKVLSPDLGDTLYPLFDKYGDMIAFARGYEIKEAGTNVQHFDVYTADFEYKYVNVNNKWDLDPDEKLNPIPNNMKKIPVIYYSQPYPEWHNQESMISRLETLVSNHADMNDYFGSPILAVSGKVQGFASKGEQGKIIELSQEAKAHYLALESKPESITSEVENLEAWIYALSQTPNISFSEMKEIGDISGIALRLLFIDAHMAVKSKEETFGIGLQRRLNLLKAAVGLVVNTSMNEVAQTVQLKPVLVPYLPQNTTELIENLSLSVTGGLMSQESAVEQHPLVTDPEVELKRIRGEEDLKATLYNEDED